MNAPSRLKSVIVPVLTCLLAAGLAACSSLTGSDDGSCSSASWRPATLAITGVTGTAYACGIVQNTQNPSFLSVSLNDKDISNNAYVVMTFGAGPGTYPFNASNIAKIQFNYATEEQTGFCNAPSGTITITSLVSPGAVSAGDLSPRGRVGGSFSNVTLCRQGSGATISHTVSGTFEVR